MNADKRKETIATVLAMNFIPFVIAIYTLWLIIIIAFKPMPQFTLDGIIRFILFVSLPVLGITTYILSFVHRNTMGSKNVWLLGSINSVIWCIIFLLFSGIALVENIGGGVFSLLCFLYFAILFNLNDKLYGFEKNQELSQFEVNP
jgi:hypothetical protein